MARVSGAGLLQPAGDQRVGERRLPDLGDPQPGRPHLDGHAEPDPAVRQRRDRHRPGLQDCLLPVGAPGDDLVGRGDDLGAGRRRLPRRDANWTIDAPNGYQQNARGTDFFIKTPIQAPARTRSRNARSPALAASAWTGC